MQEFCDSYFLENMVKKKYGEKKHVSKILQSLRTCIDVIITNKPGMFQNAKTYETGLSDFHKLVVSIMKRNQKRPPRMIKHRDY